MPATLELFEPGKTTDITAESSFQGGIEGLRQESNIGQFFQDVDTLAQTIYFNSPNPEFISFRKSIEQGVDDEVIRNAVTLQDVSGIVPTTPEYDQLSAAISLKEQISRTVVRRVLTEGENKLGLSPAEKVVLLGSCDMADQFDLLYRMWHQNVAVDPLALKLQGLGKAGALEYLKQQGVEVDQDHYLYLIFQESEDGRIDAIPYAAAFRHNGLDPIGKIGQTIDQMNDELGQLAQNGDIEAEVLRNYYQAFKDALSSTDIAQHEKLWETVDRLWMKIGGRMQPIHPMESYVDSLGIRVEPDYALTFLDDRFQRVNQLIATTKEGLIAYLGDNFTEKKTYPQSLEPMQNSVAGVYTTLISGRRLVFRPAGQNIPNREDVRMKDGVKIFIDMKSMSQRWQVQKALLVKIFGEDYVAEKFGNDEEIILAAAGIDVPGHEVAHNAFIDLLTRSTIGSDIYQQIEEAKADLAIVSATPAFLSSGDLSPFTKSVFAAAIRALSLKQDVSRRPYYNSALVILNAMVQADILTLSGTDGWKYDDAPRKLEEFFKLVREAFSALVDVYDDMDSQKATDYIQDHFRGGHINIYNLEVQLGVADEKDAVLIYPNT